MALGSITRIASYAIGNRRARVCDVQLTSGANYTTGGETVTPAAVGLMRRIEQVQGAIPRATSGGATARTIGVDYSAISGSPGAVKIQVYTTASAEAAGNSDQSAHSARLTFIGV